MQNVDVLLSTTQSAAWGGEQEEEKDRITSATRRKGVSTSESRRAQPPHGTVEAVREDANESERQLGRDRPPDSKVWPAFECCKPLCINRSLKPRYDCPRRISYSRFNTEPKLLSQHNEGHYQHLENYRKSLSFIYDSHFTSRDRSERSMNKNVYRVQAGAQ